MVPSLSHEKTISFTEDELRRVNELIDLRNRVHIRLSQKKDFESTEFNLHLYNEVIKLLQRISEEIYNNGVPLYKSCQSKQNEADIEEIFG